MRFISPGREALQIYLYSMLFSKSFGYLVRAVLYMARHEETRRVPLSEVAEKLDIPRHFLGKLMKRLVREGILASQKGPSGGFSITPKTLQTSLFTLTAITGETGQFDSCVLRLHQCNSLHPCPLHQQARHWKENWRALLCSTTISDLLKKDKPVS